MKIFLKQEIIIISLSLFCLVSCKKSTESKISEFISVYKKTFTSIAESNPYIVSTSAEKTAADEITIRFYTKSSGEDDNDIGIDMVRKSLPEVIGAAISQEKDGKDLINNGVKFNIKILDENGQKVFYSEVYDKNSIEKTVSSNPIQTNGGINQVLDVFNKSLPITDPTTGIKIVNISAGTDNDIIYTAVIPEAMIEVFKLDGTKEMLKDDLLRNSQIKELLLKSKAYGISKLKYIYKDEKDNAIVEVVINTSDIKF